MPPPGTARSPIRWLDAAEAGEPLPPGPVSTRASADLLERFYFGARHLRPDHPHRDDRRGTGPRPRGDVAVRDGRSGLATYEGEVPRRSSRGKAVTRFRRHPHPLRRPGTWYDVLDPPPATLTPWSPATAASGSPVTPSEHGVQRMEGVEDIPVTALAEGMTGTWRAFRVPDCRPRNYAIDIGTQGPPTAPCGLVMVDRARTAVHARGHRQMASSSRRSSGRRMGSRPRHLPTGHDSEPPRPYPAEMV